MRPNIFHARRLCHFVAGIVLACTVIAADRASAEVTDVAQLGFSVSESAHIAAPGDKIYAALITPQHWWSGKHTFSGNPANLTFDAKAGGCWCETMPDGGSVEHMTVVFVSPGKTLRLRGAMGPFQEMATTTVMTWSLKPSGDGTDVTLVSATGGYTKGGLQGLAPILDRVFGEQINRLKTYVETGAAAPN
ncbi:MAG TPA: SRPBCC domain-containing protein [Rhizomicrobium sp.]|nr:SRPBCC domain-containing protein [Rhizomicrobium sp.]